MLKTFTSCLLALGATSLVGVIAPAQAFTPLSLTQTFNNPTPEDDDSFGNSVSLSGTLALIGANGDNTGAQYAGSAYLFDTTTYNLLQTFNNPTPQIRDYFGTSVSLSSTSAFIGAPFDDTGATDAGSAYLYQQPQTVPEPSFTILGTGVVLGALPLLKKGKKTKDKDA
ncbi:FG-GAP repeat protein [Microcystis aeruginosa CS-564/01]|uniref:FG-GAP repeat protein n=1 Tax=Microcystis aeruginosa TaxID=1126 RepID=UPI00232B2ADF|nr:FG-GAP repeat protein [Microcystis aeruginosa]MDB9424005.1 FG-GAP repeat protein [Microcystis aeruginosa CS-564/01]